MKQEPTRFTKLEIAIWLIGIIFLALIVWNQKNLLDAQHRDSSRKVAINAIRANLEEVTYAAQDGYPEYLDSKIFSAIDSSLLEDQNGVAINKPGSEYSYEPSSCNRGICKHYQLRAILEKESPFIQKSLR